MVPYADDHTKTSGNSFISYDNARIPCAHQLEIEAARLLANRLSGFARFLEDLNTGFPDNWISAGVHEVGRKNLLKIYAHIVDVKPSHTKMYVEDGREQGGELELEVVTLYHNRYNQETFYRVRLNPCETRGLMKHRGNTRFVEDLIGDRIRVYTTIEDEPKGIGARTVQ